MRYTGVNDSLEADEVFYRLAPTRLKNFRVGRYGGDSLSLPISAFTPEDEERLRHVYVYLQRLEETTSRYEPSAGEALAEFLSPASLKQIIDVAVAFGGASFAAQPNALMAKTVHDLRGGGLTALLGQMQLAAFRPLNERAVKALFFLARDHLKIMRNAVRGLDDPRRLRDTQLKIHRTDLLVEKWHGASLQANGRAIRMQVDCRHSAAISQCCLEFGALDRVLYNLINNACRHAAGASIRLVLLPMPDDEGENVRFVLANELKSTEFAKLSGTNLASLFVEGNSTTGSGYGLSIVTDFVSDVYGLRHPREAIDGGYLGAAIVGDLFAIWFHWPRVMEE